MRTLLLFILLMSFTFSTFADHAHCYYGHEPVHYTGVYNNVSPYEQFYIFNIAGTIHYLPTSHCVVVRK